MCGAHPCHCIAAEKRGFAVIQHQRQAKATEPRDIVVWGPMSAELVSDTGHLVRVAAVEKALPMLLKRGGATLKHQSDIVGHFEALVQVDASQVPQDAKLQAAIEEVIEEYGGVPSAVLTVTATIAEAFPRLKPLVGQNVPFLATRIFPGDRFQEQVRQDVLGGRLDSYSIDAPLYDVRVEPRCDENGCILIQDVQDLELTGTTLCSSTEIRAGADGATAAVSAAGFLVIQQATPGAQLVLPGADEDRVYFRDRDQALAWATAIKGVDAETFVQGLEERGLVAGFRHPKDAETAVRNAKQVPIKARGLEFEDHLACVAWAKKQPGIKDADAFCGQLEGESKEAEAIMAKNQAEAKTQQAANVDDVTKALDVVEKHVNNPDPSIRLKSADYDGYSFTLYADGAVQATYQGRAVELPDDVMQRVKTLLESQGEDHVWVPNDAVKAISQAIVALAEAKKVAGLRNAQQGTLPLKNVKGTSAMPGDPKKEKQAQPPAPAVVKEAKQDGFDEETLVEMMRRLEAMEQRMAELENRVGGEKPKEEPAGEADDEEDPKKEKQATPGAAPAAPPVAKKAAEAEKPVTLDDVRKLIQAEFAKLQPTAKPEKKLRQAATPDAGDPPNPDEKTDDKDLEERLNAGDPTASRELLENLFN